jgi:two-component system chemotaxis response regulator CheB
MMSGMDVETRDRFSVIALVSSAGGLDALTRVLAPLEPGFPAAVIALQHTAPAFDSKLARILDGRSMLPVRAAADGDPLTPGEVLVIPAGVHMLVGTDARVRLIKSGALPPARPSADLLLSTLAVALGPRVIAVVLTGGGTDGALGAQAVHAYGGRVFVQDEDSSQQFGMPRATVKADSPGTPLPLGHIAETLATLVRA